MNYTNKRKSLHTLRKSAAEKKVILKAMRNGDTDKLKNLGIKIASPI